MGNNNGQAQPDDHLASIPLDRVIPNPQQPRKVFEPDALRELADSIAQHGVIQPIEVTAVAGSDLFVIRHGERRVRASRMAGKDSIAAVISHAEYDDNQLLIRALIENVQRENMLPSEEGEAFQALLLGMSMVELAAQLGRSIGYISGRISWLKFDQEIRDMVDSGDIPRDLRVSRALESVPEIHRLPLLRRLVGAGKLTIKGVLATVEAYHALAPDEKKSRPAQSEFNPQPCAKRNRASVRAHSLTIVYGDCDPDGPEAEMVESAAQEACRLCPLFAHGLTPACHECGMTVFLRVMRRKRRDELRREA